ncbi:MAG TPA: FtsW/RodA/SpoVE family cell cycle protein [Actinomycetota bacterium]|nr:FtsW/RodA/SpoVE family cell cycle protein [Actinomycetota bacterium]
MAEAVDRIGGEPVGARMARKAPIRHLDPTLLLVTLILSAYGALMVLSVTVHSQTEAGLDPNQYLKRQLMFVAIGVGLLFLMSFIDYRRFRALAPIIYGLTLIGLVIVLTPIGTVQGGASRWINIGFLQAQPSELAKIAVIVVLAAYLAERKGDVRARDIVFCCLAVAVPGALIYLEPDLGTMMVFVALTGALFLVGGAKIRHFLVLAGAGLIAVVVVLQLGLLQEYQIQRLTSFLDPNPNVKSYGYNLVQAKIAIASGGIRGKGLELDPQTSDPSRGNAGFPLDCSDAKNVDGTDPCSSVPSTSTALDFVPEQHTDFIFTAVGEQLGFMGSATLLALFAFLIWRALRIAALSKDTFGALLATGVAALWAFQLFVNVGMTMGIMPITGIPLPFISYGGSSLITNYLAVGILLNVHMRRFL